MPRTFRTPVAETGGPSASLTESPDPVEEGNNLTITVHMITVHMSPLPCADQTDKTVRVVVIDSGLNHSVSKLYSVTFGAGDDSKTVTHTAIDGPGAATGRIAVELASAPADAPYVLGNPYKGRVDVID